MGFQHTAARRRLLHSRGMAASGFPRFNTQPRGGGCRDIEDWIAERLVSTHSRAEAAAAVDSVKICTPLCFNTQPRGGGCCIDQTKCG